MTMKIFCSSPLTGEFTGESIADESPLEGGVFLIPACASENPPPPTAENEVAVLIDGQWIIKADWRNVTLYSNVSGAPVEIGEIGVTSADLCATDKPLCLDG